MKEYFQVTRARETGQIWLQEKHAAGGAQGRDHDRGGGGPGGAAGKMANIFGEDGKYFLFQCWERTACKLGEYSASIPGKDIAFIVFDRVAPSSWLSSLNIIKDVSRNHFYTSTFYRMTLYEESFQKMIANNIFFFLLKWGYITMF